MPDSDTDKPAVTAHAILLGDRLAVDRTGYSGVISTTPFCFRKGDGYVALFRYGAAVFIGLSHSEEAEALAQLMTDTAPGVAREEESVTIELRPSEDEGFSAAGQLQLRDLTGAHVLVLADVLAKSVALAHYERDIAAVLDTIEPAATRLAASGRVPKTRKALLKLIGEALLAQHRVSGRISFAEKPEILWDRPELERFYARLEDEYEIIERGTLLNGKVGVISTAAETFTDIIDTQRSARLELLIVILILAELVLAITPFRH
jgi:required for meiotic nuclear division protein 1